MYECLTLQTQIDVNASDCLNKYYDYAVENCLRDYEAKFNGSVGFIGTRPDMSDPFMYKSEYWAKYSNLTLEV